jgi:hypothetical protein
MTFEYELHFAFEGRHRPWQRLLVWATEYEARQAMERLQLSADLVVLPAGLDPNAGQRPPAPGERDKGRFRAPGSDCRAILSDNEGAGRALCAEKASFAGSKASFAGSKASFAGSSVAGRGFAFWIKCERPAANCRDHAIAEVGYASHFGR